MHAHEDLSSQGEANGDRAGRGERSRHGRPSARELARLRLKEVAAYVSVDELSVTQQDETDAGVEDDVSSDTKRKRKQRQEDEAANRHQFSVKMPKDDPVLKETIKMVAARLVQDREFHRALDGLVSDPSLREIVDCAASSPGDAALIAKAARSGGLLQMAKIADANEKLANCMARLVGDVALLEAASALLRDFSEVAAARGAKEPLDAACFALRDPSVTLRFCEVRQRGGVRARILGWILGSKRPDGKP